MYFPVGWPKALNLGLPGESALINHICTDAVKILVATVGDDFLGIWYANPLIPITFYRRDAVSLEAFGRNKYIVWKPDSRELAILTTLGALLLYQIDFDANGSSILTQIDPPTATLKRDSAELFIKENIPRLSLHEVCSITLNATITTVSCISLTELLIATDRCELIRTQWSELQALANDANANGVGAIAAINLRSIPFYVNQNCNLRSFPPIGHSSYVAALEYSPFIGGCAAVFNDNRAAFLIAAHLRFETQNIHGFWVSDVEDATVCSVNHKFRLLAYGRANSEVNVYGIEDATGGLEYSHRLSVNASVPPGSLGAVNEMRWSPDGCVLVVAWRNGGISLWSTFGALLMSSLSWDFGLNVDLVHCNPLRVSRLEWSTEGYQLFMTCQRPSPQANATADSGNNVDSSTDESSESADSSNVLQLNFVKSTLAMNPCMASHPHVLLQGDDTLYLNQGNNLERIYFGSRSVFPNNHAGEAGESSFTSTEGTADADGNANGKTKAQANANNDDDSMEVKKSVNSSSILSESKYWTVLQLPQTYASTNWPIRYSAIDEQGLHLAVAGRTGLAHYSMVTRRWKLFGNESQEKDFVVSGGLLWWKSFVVMGCYSLLDRTDEIRCYPEQCKLDNQYGNKIQVRAPVISLNMFRDQLIVLTADGIVSLFALRRRDAYTLNVDFGYEVDVKSICVHPACIVSLAVTNLRNDVTTKFQTTGASATAAATSTTTTSTATASEVAETIIVNVCGRIQMIQRESRDSVGNSLMASCLASCVETFWLSNAVEKSPMRDCLWLYSGVHGMRVWLPILPPAHEQVRDAPQRLHTFMSKRIMLAFPLKLYPLVILFDNVVALGVENETTLYTSETQSHFALPFCLLERKSQVYLHKILRQLIKRNLGYSAWEIAKSCRSLPYFPHSLELLLHEVLEEEATSKEPIPDALLPSILDFIREFPVYLQTIVQCARKTEIALWPYLFSIAGKPKDLFQQCLQSEELETAASYLIILQNLEPSVVSKQYATLLLDIALQNGKWELAKDLVRFLKAIDPNEIDSPRSSMVVNLKIAPPSQAQSQVNQNPEVFNLVLGPIARERSFSTTGVNVNLPKDKKEKASTVVAATAASSAVPAGGAANETALMGGAPHSAGQLVLRRKSERSNSTKERKETFCVEAILQRHARKLLEQCKVIELGYMSAFLDFHLVTWLSQEADRTAKLDDYVAALTCLHEQLLLTAPFAQSTGEQQGPDDEELTLSTSSAEYTQLEREFSLGSNRANGQACASSQTSESGYFSLALMDTPTNNGHPNQGQIPAIKENEELQYSSLPAHPTSVSEYSKSRSNSQISFDNARYRREYSMHEELPTFGLGIDCASTADHSPRILSDKLSIKIRYLLQLFIEANCTDYALVLSIMLQDAASIGRIINVVMRSESLAACKRIDLALKHLTQWSFGRECLYRSFMINLQPHLYLLDQYLVSTTSATGNSNGSGIGSLNAGRKTDDINGLCDPTVADGRCGSLGDLAKSKHHLLANGHNVNGNGNNWTTLDKYGHNGHNGHNGRNGHRLSRHNSLDAAGKASALSNGFAPGGASGGGSGGGSGAGGGSVGGGSSGDRHSSKEHIARNETGSCGIM